MHQLTGGDADRLAATLRDGLAPAREIFLLGPGDRSDSGATVAWWRDWWKSISRRDRQAIVAVAGPTAGHLATVVRRQVQLFSTVHDPGLIAPDGTFAEDSSCSPQSAALLELAHAAASVPAIPGDDAAASRMRLAAVLSRWPWVLAAEDRLLMGVAVLSQRLGWSTVNVTARQERRFGRARPCDWLDAELHELALALTEGSSLRRRADRAIPAPTRENAPSLAGALRTLGSLDGVVERAEAEARLDGKFIEGRDGWLFLANDRNRVLDQISGRLRLSAADVAVWSKALDARGRRVEAVGARYAYLVPPNAHCVYPDKLPDGVAIAEERPVTQLLAARADARVDVPLIYPLDALRAGRSIREPYPQTESHWNDWGAWIAYQRLCDELQARGVVLRRLRDDDVTFAELAEFGDLGWKARRRVKVPLAVARFAARQASLVDDNRVRNTGRRAIYECSAAPDTSCVMFGDSFSMVMLKYLAESFRRLVFGHLPETADFGIVEAERPNLVLSVANERFLIRVPDDATASTLEDRARVKRQRGMIFDRNRRRRTSVLVSVALDPFELPSDVNAREPDGSLRTRS